MRVAADTDTGRVRRHNEDAFLIASELGLFAVADGVGGHVGGVEASRLVVTELPALFREELQSKPDGGIDNRRQDRRQNPSTESVSMEAVAVNSDSTLNSETTLDSDATLNSDDSLPTEAHGSCSQLLEQTLSDTDIQRRLYRAIRRVNSCVFKAGGERASESRMGATLTGAVFLSSGTTLIFNVGDSRTYCYRNRELSCITKDQSWYQNWLDEGSIGMPPPKSIILQGVGLDQTVVPDWCVKPWLADDLWLMCSDGLSDRVSDEEITALIEAHLQNDTSLVALCGELITAANAAGGEDNITVLALRPNTTSP